MKPGRRSAVQKYHDRVAGQYDQSYEDGFWRWHDSLTWDYLKPYLPRDLSTRIVDLGCGTGKWTAKLARSGYRVTGVDISIKMLDQARRKIESQAGGRGVDFHQADLCDLSALPQHEFSLAIALGDPIGCAASPAKAMSQIRRILKDRGILVASFDNRLAAIDFFLGEGDPKAFVRFLKDGRTRWFTKDPSERFEVATFAPNDLKRLIEAAGFEVLEMIGKTVLPMRHHRELIATAESRRTWANIEKKLCRNPAAMGRASHLQVACKALPR